MVTLLTPTADQPVGMALCEQYMAAQTCGWDDWIVVDDGVEPARLTLGQRHIRRPREPGCLPAESLCRNLLAALPLVRTPVVVIIEHDDWYREDHLERLVGRLEQQPDAVLAGDDEQRYYHVATRRWKVFNNWGAALCQTALRAEALPVLRAAAEHCLRSKWRGVDAHLWRRVDRSAWSVAREQTVVGIKGLPGRAGIGIGHRPDESWTPDPSLDKLREWVGPMSVTYGEYAGAAA